MPIAFTLGSLLKRVWSILPALELSLAASWRKHTSRKQEIEDSSPTNWGMAYKHPDVDLLGALCLAGKQPSSMERASWKFPGVQVDFSSPLPHISRNAFRMVLESQAAFPACKPVSGISFVRGCYSRCLEVEEHVHCVQRFVMFRLGLHCYKKAW